MSEGRLGRVLLAGLLSLAPGLASAEPSVTVLPLGFAASHLRGPGTEIAGAVATSGPGRDAGLTAGRPSVLVWGEKGAAALTLADGRLVVTPLPPDALDGVALTEIPRGAIPFSRRTRTGALTAFLSDPTRSEPHAALGEPVHAAALTISERQPVAMTAEPTRVPVTTSRVEAGPDAVFEDRLVRSVPLDGRTSFLVVKSYRERGSALALVGRKAGGAWSVLAETPPTGTPQNWLNPAAVADFGDGRPQVALVKSPHLAGILQLWDFGPEGPVLRLEAPGYSNHAFGSPVQDLAAAVDADGDGIPDLAIPTLDRSSLAILSLKGRILERARIPLPAPAALGVAALGQGRETRLIVGLADGRVVDVRP